MADGLETLTFAAEVARLSTLSALAYDQERHAVATRLKVRVTTLDAEVAKLRGAHPTALDAAPPDVDAAIAEFNDRYMVVNEDGKATIFVPKYDPVLKRERIDRMSFDDIRRLYLNRYVQIGENEKGEPIRKSVAELWLRSPDRKQYINGVTFDPSGRPQQEGVLNLWKGYAIQPAKGDWKLMRSHIHDIICAGEEAKFRYLMGWMARMFQHPDERGHVAVVMRSGEGSGKGTLAKALMTIIGHHSMSISNSKHLTGNFNGHLRDVVFLFADEAFFAGDKASIGTLKSIITEPLLTIESKYQNAVQVPNYLHVLMASNEEWVVPASHDARRFLVLDVLDTCRGAHGYFEEIWKEMDNGGYEAMLHDLLEYDLTDFNVRDVPKTAGLEQQKKLSFGTTDAWWMDVLHRGYVYQSKHGQQEHFGQWHASMPTELLYASYLQFVQSRRERHPISREALGRQMKKYGAQPARLTKPVVGEQIADVETNYGTTRKAVLIRQPQAHGYHLGNLEDSRTAFCEEAQVSVDWDGAL